MKMGTIRIEPNDDGTFQVNVDARESNGDFSHKEIKLSATSLEDVSAKIKEAQKKIEGLKDKKKEGKDNSTKAFLS